MTKIRITILLFLSFYILNSAFYICNATIRYVSHTGTSTPPYTSWETAADSIQKAIDICEPGDTVLVANGIYEEYLIINTPILLIGSSIDSTIIDGSQIQNPPLNSIINFKVNGSIKYFTVKGNGQNDFMNGIVTITAPMLTIEYCRIIDFFQGIALGNSSSTVSHCIFRNCEYAIRDECPNNNCFGIYTNNIIISKNSGTSPAIGLTFGGYPTFINNIVIEEGTNSWIGIFSGQKPGAVLENNIVSGYHNRGISIGTVTTDTTHIINNTITDNSTVSIVTLTGGRTQVENNIIKKGNIGLNGQDFRSDYNLFWDINILTGGTAYLGEGNIVANPMFIKDTIPNPQLDFDFHLQAYSPAIDAGNPDILDVDSSKSDIGVFGGPLGKSYKYLDLSPRPPRNFSAILDTNYILLKWNRNTEADTSHYNVYRDTVINFTIDSTNLISTQTDTFFIQYPPYISSQYVYKITCVDNQGNESLPSEEIVIKTTSIDEYPFIVNDYILYQNYPNPFNPSTTIGYKLKARGYVKLVVYDIKGEMIDVLVNKEQEAGYYEVEFTLRNFSEGGLASGIYLYRIEVIGEGNIPVYSEMKKMILLK